MLKARNGSEKEKMDYKKQIQILRRKIDKIDRDIIHNLSERIDISKKISKIKRKNNLTIRDIRRENDIINNLSNVSTLNRKFIDKIFNEIFEESRRIQR